ncbi:MAG: Mrp/NBP35 family ATP-binding protein [Hyphomicrobiales bacterium]|nr:Mrp/NBP35 family ATP-binding protein [Hyphomicrobiales bacterium]
MVDGNLKAKVLEKLRTITADGIDQDIVSEGLVSDIVINEGKVVFAISVPENIEVDLGAVKHEAENLVSEIDGVGSVLVALTAERKLGSDTPQVISPPKLKREADRPVGPDMRPAAGTIPGIKSVLAVASGKGGVGKSTTAVNLALGLRSLGLRVGLLDADIYGPSIPRLLGVADRPSIENDRIVPLRKFELEIMSMGFMMDEEAPVIWRGPMVVSALMQMVREVEWGNLDVLVVDMPPGTGDTQLTLAQQVPLAGAVIVSTPQDLALVDARKGLKMFKNVHVPIMGIIENMSSFACPHCGEVSDIFGRGGAEADARALNVTFLGAIPLHMSIRENSDAGTPIVISEPDCVHAKAYKDIALKVATIMENEVS